MDENQADCTHQKEHPACQDHGGLSLVLVIETSSHIQAILPAIHRLGSIFTESVMALDGEAAVVTYDSTVEVRQPFTKDHDAVEKSIIQTEPGGAPEMKLYDAMAASVQLLKEQPSNHRRVMLIIGESQDSESEANLEQVARDAVLANIPSMPSAPAARGPTFAVLTCGLSRWGKVCLRSRRARRAEILWGALTMM